MAKRTPGKTAVEKGKAYERKIVNVLKAAGIECKRNVAQSRSAKREGCDIEGTPWWIELTHAKAADPEAKWEQAFADQDGGDMRPIIVIWRRDGFRGDLATMTIEAAIDLYGASHGDPLHGYDSGPLVTMALEDAIEMMADAAQRAA